MHNRRTKLLILLSIGAVIYVTYTYSSGQIREVLFGLMALLFGISYLAKIVFVGTHMHRSVKDQAAQHKIPTGRMWARIFGKVGLYILLPAAIFTLVTVGIALIVTGGNR